MPVIKRRMIYASLLMALVLQLFPWSGSGLYLRPDFVLLALLFWMLRAPQYCNIGLAWVAGLAIDLASGSLFGQNALAYAITAFFAIVYQRRLILFTDLQQTSYVFLLLLINQFTLFLLKLFAGAESPGYYYFLSCITGILLWHFVIVRLFSPSGRH